MEFTEEGRYSRSRASQSIMITKLIKTKAEQLLLNTKQIVDATACNGGDTFTFTRYFDRVTAVEVNDDNFKVLKKNALSMGFKPVDKRLRLLHDDFLVCYERFSSDIVYFDPPWGGVDYKTKPSIRLQMSGVPIHRVVTTTLEAGAKLCAIKVPSNFDFNDFRRTVKHRSMRKYPVANYYLIMVW